MEVDRVAVPPNEVFGRSFRDGLVLGVIAGAASGTAAAPVLGTIVGALVGFCVAIPVALVTSAVIVRPVRSSGAGDAFRRRLDITFAVLALGTAALAIGWISLDPLVGSAPAITMLVVVVLGLLLVRRRLRRLAPLPAD